MAGVIYTEPAETQARDESWLTAGFRITPWTTRCEWRSPRPDRRHPSARARGQNRPGCLPVPGADRLANCEGVVFGQFFDTPTQSGSGDVRQDDPVRIRQSWRVEFSCAQWLMGRRRLGWHDSTSALCPRLHRRSDAVCRASWTDGSSSQRTCERFMRAECLRELDEEAIAQFLHYLYVPAPRTLVSRLHGGPSWARSEHRHTRRDRKSTPRLALSKARRSSTRTKSTMRSNDNCRRSRKGCSPRLQTAFQNVAESRWH